MSNENHVWTSERGKMRGQSILPLYSSVPDAMINDNQMHKLLSWVDALQIGKAKKPCSGSINKSIVVKNTTINLGVIK